MGKSRDRHERRRSHEDEEDDERRLRHKKSSKRKRHADRRDEKRRRKRKRRHYSDDSSSGDSDGSSASSFDSRRHDRKRKHKEKKQKKHKKKDKKKSRRDKEAKKECNYELADALLQLLESHPNLATELPIILIRLAGGTTLDFTQMPDQTVARGLNNILQTLMPYGLAQENGAWKWISPSGTNSGNNDLVLIKVVRSLLSDIGIDMSAFRAYEQQKRQEENATTAASLKEKTAIEEESKQDDQAFISLRQETRTLLNTFDQPSSEERTNLSNELASIINLVLEGESIDLEGLTNKDLRNALQKLFQSVGLEQVEMENESEEENEQDGNAAVALGYGLAEDVNSAAAAKANLMAVLAECQNKEPVPITKSASTQPRRVLGPSFPPTSIQQNDESSSSEDEQGPAPAGSAMARKRVQRGPTMPPEMLEAMARERTRQLKGVATGIQDPSENDPTQREEWMVVPGEHELLQGIKSGKAPIKSRTFKNEKQSSSQLEEQPIDPKIQAEMDAIHQLHQEARGPSLMEQHKLKKQAEKASAQNEWKWNRESDLDAGRRVDKNALHMVMGGAKNELKSKFQGGYSRGFM